MKKKIYLYRMHLKVSNEWNSSWRFIEQPVSKTLDVEMEKNFKSINQIWPVRVTSLIKINLCCVRLLRCVLFSNRHYGMASIKSSTKLCGASGSKINCHWALGAVIDFLWLLFSFGCYGRVMYGHFVSGAFWSRFFCVWPGLVSYRRVITMCFVR